MAILDKIYTEIYYERMRQERLLKEGKFVWTCADQSISDTDKFCVLAEEVGEVAKEVTEAMIGLAKGVAPDFIKVRRDSIRAELIQVAAVCVAWIESIDGWPKA